ncbi:MAG: ferredoxin--NADP reductase [Saprospiraceae bacterium]
MNFYIIKIDLLVKETVDAVSIGFNLDADHPLKQFNPGQYLTVKYKFHGEEFLRCYSISSIPKEESLFITVKRTKQGFISNELVTKSHVGMELEIGAPHGKFKISSFLSKRRSHYFFAAGSGITPIISMIQYLLEEEITSNIYLLYGNRKEEDIIFYQKIQTLATKYEGQFKVFFVLSNSRRGNKLNPFLLKKNNWMGWNGRIDDKLIGKFIDTVNDQNKEKEYYICGPGNFIQQVEKSLHKIEIEQTNIHKEYFSIQTIDSNSNEKEKLALLKSNLTFRLNNQKYTIETKEGEKILDAIIRNGFDPPHSCSSGACATCIATKISGEVRMDSSLALDQSEIDSGLILTCQSRCLTETVEIEFDE